MRILFLHQHFKSPKVGGAIRSYYLAEALVAAGHEVVVIAGAAVQSTIENLEGIKIHWLAIPYDNRFGFYARGWSFIRFIFMARSLATRLGKFEICYAISTPLTIGLCAMWIKRKTGIPFVFEVGDLWPDAPIELGVIRNYFLKKSLLWLERLIYRRAEFLVALSPAISEALKVKIPGKRVEIIPNISDCDFYRPAFNDSRPEADSGSKKFVILYAGSIGRANGLESLLDCAQAAEGTGAPIQFVISGQGGMLERLRAKASSLKLNNVTFTGFVNREGVRDLMDAADAVTVWYQNYPILETGCPNKYMDGLAAGKLIILNFGGWIRREVEENSCGVFVDPNDPEDFLRKVKPFLTDVNKLRNAQLAARAVSEREYSRKKLREAFVNLFR